MFYICSMDLNLVTAEVSGVSRCWSNVPGANFVSAVQDGSLMVQHSIKTTENNFFSLFLFLIFFVKQNGIIFGFLKIIVKLQKKKRKKIEKERPFKSIY